MLASGYVALRFNSFLVEAILGRCATRKVEKLTSMLEKGMVTVGQQTPWRKEVLSCYSNCEIVSLSNSKGAASVRLGLPPGALYVAQFTRC